MCRTNPPRVLVLGSIQKNARKNGTVLVFFLGGYIGLGFSLDNNLQNEKNNLSRVITYPLTPLPRPVRFSRHYSPYNFTPISGTITLYHSFFFRSAITLCDFLLPFLKKKELSIRCRSFNLIPVLYVVDSTLYTLVNRLSLCTR